MTYLRNTSRGAAGLALAALLAACSFGQQAQESPTTPAASAPTAAPAAAATAPAAQISPTSQPTGDVATTAAPSQAAAAKPDYQQAECKFNKPAGVTVTCGYLTVPEDRAKAEGKTIKLHVAVFKSKNPNPQPDPVVYLEGGPGGHALDNLEFS